MPQFNYKKVIKELLEDRNLKNSLNVLKFEVVREIQSGKNHQCPTNPFGKNGTKILKYRCV